MRKRKTIEVESVREYANRALTDMAQWQDEAWGKEGAAIWRRGVAMLLEDILHNSGNYNGFQYTDPDAVHDEHGIVAGSYDETRRRYL